MVLLVGAFIGPIYDRGYLRTLLVTGTFLIVFGHMMLSLCTTYWQCLLAQGFTVGIGGGFLYIPSLAILPGYFSTRIGLAIGVAASGSSLGGIIYPIMFYKLIGQVSGLYQSCNAAGGLTGSRSDSRGLFEFWALPRWQHCVSTP